MPKKVLLFVIDGLASRVVGPELKRGQLPNLLALAEAGTLFHECISTFPSITPSALSSIITGNYPAEHQIAGAYWYDKAHDSVAYYGEDLAAIMNRGVGTFLHDFMYRLNHERLGAKTLFQLVEESGKQAANLNLFVYRGNQAHELQPPLLLRLAGLLPGVDFSKRLYGPSILYLGDFVPGPYAPANPILGKYDKRFGFQDEISMTILQNLLAAGERPDFICTYCPDNDWRSHEVGPVEALDCIRSFDQQLGNVYELMGGLEALLRDYAVLILGDHAHCPINAEDYRIDLESLLGDFVQAAGGTHWQPQDEVMICPNLRMAHVYFQQPQQARVAAAIRAILADPNVDQVLWHEQQDDLQERRYHVETPDRGSLRFWRGRSAGAASARDGYGCDWSWEGELAAVDGLISEGEIQFPDYPNAFERIVKGMDLASSGHLWVTARPGYEVGTASTSMHVGGSSHAALHAQDSVTMLFTAGLPPEVTLPRQPRIVDAVPLALAALGIPSPLTLNRSHVLEAVRIPQS